ncbi:ABC transporter permease [Methanobacterium petrolearium]|uniref:ABC transporter permease n=1 Tax=Methanobacterium petrolearium TaxID=710190 RepID=UPI001AEB492F|nr:ABC transporter permease [Methanobacterium petrolearium]MBP1945621.1 ABC-2 type transport system permease protein [Methanobacterium petrolearium]BDZ71853.1 mannose-1-phosphate guanyltransferase [Methanobacterium petrolearium]
MKFISIAKKDFKELIRDRRGLAMILLFPLFFMLVFGFAFGGMGESNQPHNLAVVNYDKGATMPSTGEHMNFGNNMTKILEDSKYENTDVHIFNVTKTTETDADNKLKQRDVDAELIIPENFSQSVVSLITSTLQQQVLTSTSTSTSPNVTSTIIIRGDTGYVGFGVSQGILAGVLEQYKDKVVSQIQSASSGSPGIDANNYISSQVEAIPGTGSFTTFDFMAPGMIVFAILLLTTTVAAALTREVEKGTLARLKLSKMTSFDLLFGGLLPWSLVAAAQVVILLTVAVLIGFHWQGGLYTLLLAVFVGIIGGIASVSLGMIIAAFARNDRQAANLATLICVPTSFLVGAFFQLPQVIIANIWGQPFQIYDLLPWTHVLNALRSTLTFGGGWDTIAYQVGWALILTIILFIVGILLFSRNRLRAEN